MEIFRNSAKGDMDDSPTFYQPATDRERAIARLQTIAGDPTRPVVCEEQQEARDYLRQLVREDPELRARLRYWKQFVDAPNGKERLYKEVVLPKLFEQMRFRRTAYHDSDYYTVPWSFDPNRSLSYFTSPWFQGFCWHYSDATQLWNYYYDNKWVHTAVLFTMAIWTRGWWIRHFGSRRAMIMIKNAKNSRRYFGKVVPRVPHPAMTVRNKMVLQAITRKMIRDGKAHNIHVQQALNDLRTRAPNV